MHVIDRDAGDGVDALGLDLLGGGTKPGRWFMLQVGVKAPGTREEHDLAAGEDDIRRRASAGRPPSSP